MGMVAEEAAEEAEVTTGIKNSPQFFVSLPPAPLVLA